MLTWPHSGFHVHTAVWVPEDDRALTTRLARYCARNPAALERLTCDRAAKVVSYRSDKSEDPTAGTETVDPLEFLARVLVHIPHKGYVTTRYYGWYANRPRGMRGTAGAAVVPPAIVPAPRLAPTEATRRWAALLQQIFEVDPLACPTCHGTLRIVAFITQASVIDQILAHLRARATREPNAGPRSPPSMRAPASRGASRAPRPPLESDPGPRGRSACAAVPPRRHRSLAPPVSRRTAREAHPAVAVALKAARRCARGRGARPILSAARLNFLSRYYFMDESFEQTMLKRETLGDAVDFLTPDLSNNVSFHDGKAVGIELPTAVEMTVLENEQGIKSATASSVTKPARTETGLVVQVPAFINEGEKIRVDTAEGAYMSRA